MSEVINPQPITTRIGLIAAGWAKFKYATNAVIWHLANVDITAGACITSQIQSPSQRMKALIALVDLRGGGTALIKDLNTFSARADGLARRRNRMVHDPWLSKADRSIRVEVTADRKLCFKAHDMDLSDMDELALEIAKLIAELDKFHIRIKCELPPRPDTQYLQSLDKDPIRALLGVDADA